jgi:hypothetical protein
VCMCIALCMCVCALCVHVCVRVCFECLCMCVCMCVCVCLPLPYKLQKHGVSESFGDGFGTVFRWKRHELIPILDLFMELI